MHGGCVLGLRLFVASDLLWVFEAVCAWEVFAILVTCAMVTVDIAMPRRN